MRSICGDFWGCLLGGWECWRRCFDRLPDSVGGATANENLAVTVTIAATMAAFRCQYDKSPGGANFEPSNAGFFGVEHWKRWVCDLEACRGINHHLVIGEIWYFFR